MAIYKDVHASGAAQDGAEIRRRNVPLEQNGAPTTVKEEIDEKKSQKVRSMTGCLPKLLR